MADHHYITSNVLDADEIGSHGPSILLYRSQLNVRLGDTVEFASADGETFTGKIGWVNPKDHHEFKIELVQS